MASRMAAKLCITVIINLKLTSNWINTDNGYFVSNLWEYNVYNFLVAFETMLLHPKWLPSIGICQALHAVGVTGCQQRKSNLALGKNS